MNYDVFEINKLVVSFTLFVNINNVTHRGKHLHKINMKKFILSLWTVKVLFSSSSALDVEILHALLHKVLCTVCFQCGKGKLTFGVRGCVWLCMWPFSGFEFVLRFQLIRVRVEVSVALNSSWCYSWFEFKLSFQLIKI